MSRPLITPGAAVVVGTFYLIGSGNGAPLLDFIRGLTDWIPATLPSTSSLSGLSGEVVGENGAEVLNQLQRKFEHTLSEMQSMYVNRHNQQQQPSIIHVSGPPPSSSSYAMIFFKTAVVIGVAAWILQKSGYGFDNIYASTQQALVATSTLVQKQLVKLHDAYIQGCTAVTELLAKIRSEFGEIGTGINEKLDKAETAVEDNKNKLIRLQQTTQEMELNAARTNQLTALLSRAVAPCFTTSTPKILDHENRSSSPSLMSGGDFQSAANEAVVTNGSGIYSYDNNNSSPRIVELQNSPDSSPSSSPRTVSPLTTTSSAVTEPTYLSNEITSNNHIRNNNNYTNVGHNFTTDNGFNHNNAGGNHAAASSATSTASSNNSRPPVVRSLMNFTQ